MTISNVFNVEIVTPSTGWPTQTPSYLPVVPNLAGYGVSTLAGYGVNTRGDNVQVLYVTTLANSGTGSLSETMSRNIGGAARVIVFNVEGYSGNAFISSGLPHTTIAGQTAPGKGYCLRGTRLLIDADDFLVQHFRVRPGDGSVPGPQLPKDRSGLAMQDCARVVFDHCSVSWAGDEGISVYRSSVDCTVSHCISMQNLDLVGDGGANAHAFMCGGGSGNNPLRTTWIGNLAGHIGHRAPLVRNAAVVFVNNVIYHWYGSWGCGALESDTNFLDLDNVTAVNNYYKHGPSPPLVAPWRVRGTETVFGCNVNSKLYLEGNSVNGSIPSQVSMCSFGTGRSAAQNFLTAPSARPVWHTGIVPAAHNDAYTLVLQGVGAFSANRDSLDAQLIVDVTTGTSSGTDPTSNPAPYPIYGSAVRDHRISFNYPSGFDPIPDGASGRPAPGTINGGTGRTLIEEWCNRRAAEVEAV